MSAFDAKLDELRRGQELLCVPDIIARECAVRDSDLFYGACLKKYGASMMREKEFLTFRKFANTNDVFGINAHSPSGFFVRDIGDNELAIIFERNKAAIEQ